MNKILIKKHNIVEQFNLIKENERRIYDFETQSNEIIGDPNIELRPEDLYAPDFTVAGINQKVFKTTGQETIILLEQLTSRPFGYFYKRKYFRIAYLRAVWIPNATDLPGQVHMGMLDLRAKEGQQCITSSQNLANKMHRYTYMQDVFIHKTEYNKFALCINLKGYETKYNDNLHLGSVRVYWIFQITNHPVQYEDIPFKSEIIPKVVMPKVLNKNVSRILTKSSSMSNFEIEHEQLKESTLKRVGSSSNCVKRMSYKNNEAKNCEGSMGFVINKERVSFSQDDIGNNVTVSDPLLYNSVKDYVESNCVRNSTVNEISETSEGENHDVAYVAQDSHIPLEMSRVVLPKEIALIRDRMNSINII